ncbi:hypothetical protein P171DRAFT_136270 [Karstenula rhodostoma CBS 690.94]|uniref:Uncharacterized protein n=1 Tax=Karstenula rhodostoma CBS 690.94 TaxID=1392251 RepID=A0A9P4PVR7_9PLEO|nr:hypothetical protein P171DRAFT_136270 [Karstenula rhodostoma CBS 690.94]
MSVIATAVRLTPIGFVLNTILISILLSQVSIREGAFITNHPSLTSICVYGNRSSLGICF